MKKFLIAIIAVIFILLAAPRSYVYAQGSTVPGLSNVLSSIGALWKFQTPTDQLEARYKTGAQNRQSTAYGIKDDTMYAWCDGIDGCICILSGSPSECVGGSVVGMIGNHIASTFSEKPADLAYWIKDTSIALGFAPKDAYAQGIGFSGLAPLLPIWKAFRNIAYLLMAIVMMVIGFMIMFRKKIDPKTVITAQNAIPRVIIALILITFSYAIVGFLIDLMYVLLFFFIALFKSTGLLDVPRGLAGIAYKTPEALYSQGGIAANFFNTQVSTYQILGYNITSASDQIGASIKLGVLALIPAAVTLATPLGLGGAGIVVGLGALGIPTISLIISIFLLFLFIKLLAFFLSAYIQIIISLLMAPLQLLMEAIPGTEAFSSWFKNLIANLAVFPVGGAMFMLSSIFTHFANNATAPGTGDATALWAPPYVSLATNMTSLSSLVSLGILFAIPQVAGSIKEALKAKPVIGMPNAGGGLANMGQYLSMFYYAQQLTPKKLRDLIFGGGSAEHAG